jgi:uncharacterized membrane protein
MLWLWVAGYLVMDAIYVALSRGYYLGHVAGVAGSAPKDAMKIALCALAAYSLMALGWATIVVPSVRKGRVLAAARTGALYGLVLYGVFNATTGAMFDKWGWDVMARDTAWGTVSIAAYTAVYAKFAS